MNKTKLKFTIFVGILSVLLSPSGLAATGDFSPTTTTSPPAQNPSATKTSDPITNLTVDEPMTPSVPTTNLPVDELDREDNNTGRDLTGDANTPLNDANVPNEAHNEMMGRMSTDEMRNMMSQCTFIKADQTTCDRNILDKCQRTRRRDQCLTMLKDTRDDVGRDEDAM